MWCIWPPPPPPGSTGVRARPSLDYLQAGGFGQVLGAAPLKRDLGVQVGVAGVGNDIGLFRRGGIVGQIQIELRHTACGLEPTSDAQKIRVFDSIKAILRLANGWTQYLHTGLSLRAEENRDVRAVS